MSRPIYRRGTSYAQSIRRYLIYIQHPERDVQLDQYQLALVQAMRARLTRREVQCLSQYYIKKRSMQDTADELGIHLSTVSRTIQRGTDKLDSILRLAEKISPIRPPQSA